MQPPWGLDRVLETNLLEIVEKVSKISTFSTISRKNTKISTFSTIFSEIRHFGQNHVKIPYVCGRRPPTDPYHGHPADPGSKYPPPHEIPGGPKGPVHPCSGSRRARRARCTNAVNQGGPKGPVQREMQCTGQARTHTTGYY